MIFRQSFSQTEILLIEHIFSGYKGTSHYRSRIRFWICFIIVGITSPFSLLYGFFVLIPHFGFNGEAFLVILISFIGFYFIISSEYKRRKNKKMIKAIFNDEISIPYNVSLENGSIEYKDIKYDVNDISDIIIFENIIFIYIRTSKKVLFLNYYNGYFEYLSQRIEKKIVKVSYAHSIEEARMYLDKLPSPPYLNYKD